MVAGILIFAPNVSVERFRGLSSAPAMYRVLVAKEASFALIIAFGHFIIIKGEGAPNPGAMWLNAHRQDVEEGEVRV